MARIQVDGVTKVYDGNVVAVQQASFTAGDGEFVVLVGPSGCGKSTLLRMVAGLETISEGTVSIDGRVVNDVPPRERDVAMVFQNYALYPHMSVKDNLSLGLRIRKTPHAEIEQRVGEAAALLGIEKLLDRRPAQLSGGQRQRVAVGRAIVRRPRVFLFDEPLSNLDADMRLEMRTEINRLHTRLGATMLYVTHDQVEAMTLADRIVVLRDGQVQQVAAPLQLYNCPANRFVAGFVGSPAMNFWSARVELPGGVGVGSGAAGGTAAAASAVMLGGKRSAITGAIPRQLAALAGREVVLGVRPEDLHLPNDSAASALWAAVDSTVDVVEPLGAETLLHFRVGDAKSVVRAAAATSIKPGAPLRLHADLGRAHFFDPQTGATLVSWPGA